jgi:hypothetical protein
MSGNASTPDAYARSAAWVGACAICGKVVYLSRKVARQVVRKLPDRNPRPRAYRCPANPDHWHVGHIPHAMRQGAITREQWYEARAGRAGGAR